MGEPEFNPYHKWLGIPLSEQPPNYYRLLGIELFESDPEVIESAANQRLLHLKKRQQGQYAELSQKLSREISTARFCLLKPEIRKSYDESLGNPGMASSTPAKTESPAKKSSFRPKSSSQPKPSLSKTSKPPPIPSKNRASDADKPNAPPVQDDGAISGGEKSLKIPIIALSLVAIVLAGSLFAVMQSGDQENETSSSQVALQQKTDDDPADDQKDKPSDKKEKTESKLTANNSADQESGSDSSPPKTSSHNADQNTDVGVGKENVTKENVTKGEEKSDSNGPIQKTANSSTNSDQKKPELQGKETGPPPADSSSLKNAEDKEDKSKKGEPGDADKPLIIKTRDDRKNEPIARAPVPPTERWKPFLTPLEKQYDIKKVIPRSSRFVLFHELIGDAANERRTDKAYAQFMLALDQAKILNHASGADLFGKLFSERFDFELVEAKTLFLKEIANSLDSQPFVAQFLAEAQKTIKACEKRGDTATGLEPAKTLLEEILKIASKPIGKFVNKSYFESWLACEKEALKIQPIIDELYEKRNLEELTPKEHRLLGDYQLLGEEFADFAIEQYEKCDNKQLAALAKRDSDSTDRYEWLGIADEWYALSKKMKNEEYIFKQRARHWYLEYYWFTYDEGNMPQRVPKRIEELDYGIGMKRMPNIRAASSAVIVNRERGFRVFKGTPPTQMIMPDYGTMFTVTKSKVDDQERAQFKFSEIDPRQTNKRRYTKYESEENEFVWHDKPPMLIGDNLIRVTRGQLVTSHTLRELKRVKDERLRKPLRFSIPEAVSDFDINSDGEVFVLGQQYFYRWTKKKAWDTTPNANRTPKRFKSPVAFIPNRIKAIPKDSRIALANSRFLSIVDPDKNRFEDLHEKDELNDFDFSSDGKSYAVALNNGIKSKPLKGGKALMIPSPKAEKIRFLPGTQFVISFHADQSLRIWDTENKTGDYLIDQYDLSVFGAKTFTLSPDGKSVGLFNESAQYLFLDIHYQ